MLESIGMTSRQIRKMLTIEGAGYAVISNMAAMLFGIPASYVVFQNMNIYRIPLYDTMAGKPAFVYGDHGLMHDSAGTVIPQEPKRKHY